MSDRRDRDPQHTQKFWDAIYDDSNVWWCSLHRPVRVALGDEFGLEPGTNVAGKIVGALRKGKWGWTKV